MKKTKKSAFNSFNVKLAFVLVITIVLSSSLTYGFFYAGRRQEGENTLATSCFDVAFTEGESINLANGLAMDDAQGQNTKPYTFTIENKCDLETEYHVLVNTIKYSLEDIHINYSIDRGTAQTISKATQNSELGVNTNFWASYIIETGSLKKGEKRTIDFRAWINSETTYDQAKGKTWEAEVKVVNTVKIIEKKTLVAELLSKANPTSVTSYSNGTASELYAFNHAATAQTSAETDYRYIGDTPNNYINFNGETWRIVGVFPTKDETGVSENRVKIMRSNPVKTYSIFDEAGNSLDENQIALRLLNVIEQLNGNYYNRIGDYATNGLTETARSLISNATWYLGAGNRSKSGEEFYASERATTTGALDFITKESYNTFSKNVGLLYASDFKYTYSLGIDEACYGNEWLGCYDEVYDDRTPVNTAVKSWIYNDIFNDFMVLANPMEDAPQYGMYALKGNSGVILRHEFYAQSDPFEIIPTVYLKSDITVTGGTGTAANPYTVE